MLFYHSPSHQVSYQDLIDTINTKEHYYKHYGATTYLDFISNVILNLIHNDDCTLYDYQNNIATENTEPKNVKVMIKDRNDLVLKIKGSMSSIGIYSSGTEGNPKLIFQSIQRLLTSVRIADEYSKSRWAFTYNHSHSAGIQVFLQAIVNEACLYDFYKQKRSYILEIIATQYLTHLSATPTFYRLLAPFDFNLPSVKSITFNGEKSTQDLLATYQKVCPHALIRNIYGSTESGPLMSSDSEIFTIAPRLLDKIKIVDDQLMIHHSIMSKSVHQADWYATGDMVEVVGNQPLKLKFVSRKSRVINVGGQNVNMQEIEETLLLHPLVLDAQVIPRKNQLIGNLITASIVSSNPDLNEKMIIDFLKEKLASYKVPRIIKFVDKVEVGRTGKKKI